MKKLILIFLCFYSSFASAASSTNLSECSVDEFNGHVRESWVLKLTDDPTQENLKVFKNLKIHLDAYKPDANVNSMNYGIYITKGESFANFVGSATGSKSVSLRVSLDLKDTSNKVIMVNCPSQY